jgi:hypothetical protein
MFPEPYVWGVLASESGDVDPSTANPIAPLSFEFTTHERALRLRVQFEVSLQGDPGAIPTPDPIDPGVGLLGMTITLTDPNGNSTAYEFGTSDEYAIEYTTIVPGTWTVEVVCNNMGSYSMVVEQYKPKYDDYKSWQMWKK